MANTNIDTLTVSIIKLEYIIISQNLQETLKIERKLSMRSADFETRRATLMIKTLISQHFYLKLSRTKWLFNKTAI